MTTHGGATTGFSLQGRREAFFDTHPKAKILDAALQTPDNRIPLFFVTSRVEHADLRNVGFALGRLGADIERQFLINGEIAFFFAPWRDFQRRSFNVMTNGLAEFSKLAQNSAGRGERFTPSAKVAILVSEDTQVQAKIEEWQNSSTSPTLIISVPVASDDPEVTRVELLRQLRASLGDRDLYRTQNPVTGDDFFGRQEMLRNVAAALQSDENVVILGLRRSGKTSVLRELKRQMLARGTIVTMSDLQVLEEHSVGSLAKSIASNLADDLRDARQAGLSVKIGDQREQAADNMALSDLSDRLKRVANRNADLRFVIAVDEIESAARIAKSDPDQVRTFLAALRTAAQACPNLSLAFSGVANRMFRSTVLGQGPSAVDNPMFGQVSSTYITAFNEAETGELLLKLGRPMFLSWTDEAVSDVQAATGGMPYFVRNLASAVRKSIKDSENTADFAMVTVTAAHVAAVLPLWREDAGHDWRQLIEALRLHYPEAADLLDPSLSGDELDQWIQADATTRDAAEDLAHLGLLVREEAGAWRRTEALQAIHRLIAERPMESDADEDQDTETEEGILALIRRGEAHSLELKETFRINSHTGQKDARMEGEIVRAVAGLMNADGGRLIVGVHDSGEVKGLKRDLQVFGESLDRFERWILGDLLGKRIDPVLVSKSVRLWWVRVRGAQICALEIQKTSEPAWVDDEHLHVRAGNQTLELTGRRLASFLAERA
ncbi:RNA-binding domain-containing protein [Intrasporangium flavum]|uniref:RNA-binding domain-containing protein n=1 Tax=Intrasporangium flavum TaxID=1428657 RepID=UPI00096E0D14|nr:AAA family ATPase [Intrasporangium flavum]